MLTDRFRITVVWTTALLFSALACRAVTNLGLTPTPTPAVETSTPAPTAVPTATEYPPPDPISCEDDSCLDACLERVKEVLHTLEFDPLSELYADTQANFRLVVYDVTNGILGEPQDLHVPAAYKSSQADRSAQLRAWDYTIALLPAEHHKWITQYKVFTDGPSNVLAWVDMETTDPQAWTLGVDVIDSAYPIDLTWTLVHEFGHLLTLNSDQISGSVFRYGWNQNPAICPQFLSPQGCSTPDSYINQFHQKFWKELYGEWLDTVERPAADAPEELMALASLYYVRHRDHFVREYAATSIYEDMAESFVHFVLDPKPGGNKPVEQKIRFYYDYPEMVEVRQQMIQSMCSYVP